MALLTVLNDPKRRGVLCFEEPENGVHEGRIPALVRFLRHAAAFDSEGGEAPFQVITNTHSPQVVEELKDTEIVVADSVMHIDPTSNERSSRTRMRTGVTAVGDMFNPERHLTRAEIERILRHAHDNA
ncbi:hypothetical protein GCM10011320_25250 [Neoroseomonas lacus]|uniref:ATPase AAA-type core domain-containing protein n=1 Tax=Neoroseomonas lacus TaxID=287609 RepID=A0A917KJK4_9PROT|nr:hypothetical protein GCM10011320_25250 [Neoroseomonas lacus]